VSERRETPWERWSRDPRPLQHLTGEELARAFVTYLERAVTNDRLVPIDGILYELPRALSPGGRRGEKVVVTHRLLEGTYHVVCGGRLVRIHEVDLAANARSPRARRGPAAPEETETPPEKTAADLAFERELGPVVDGDGSVLPAAATSERRDEHEDHHPPPDEERETT
jgi:hypothetical protein